MTRHIKWLDEDVDLIRQWVSEGIDAERIAERLGGRFQARSIRRKISNLDTPDTRPGKSWTQERLDLAAKLWIEGKSASEIAKILGEGLSRSAVIGMVSRMKLPPRAPTAMKQVVKGMRLTDNYKRSHPEKKVKPKSLAKPKTASSMLWHPKQPKADQPNVEAIEIKRAALAKRTSEAMSHFEGEIAGVYIEDLERHHCRWPIGDGYCGKPRQFMDTQTAPYCEHHRAKAVSPMNPRSPQNGKELYRSLRRLVV
jgi:GcrA cell cycle regulator